MENIKAKGVTCCLPLIRTAWQCVHYERTPWYAGYRDRQVKNFVKNNSTLTEAEVSEFFDWIVTENGQAWFAQKSPSNAAKFAIRWNRRLCPSAEKFIIEKAKDRGSLLSYCAKFGIVMQNMEKVTLKAAFGEDAKYEKDYIKHIEETKKKLKEFLAQLVNINQVNPELTIKQLLDTL
jgi:hypothetical protein